MVSRAVIARVSVGIVFGFKDIKSSAVLSNILFPPFSIPLLISPSVIIPIKLFFSSNTPVIPNPFSDMVKRASFRLVFFCTNGILLPICISWSTVSNNFLPNDPPGWSSAKS